ncbi:MAG TPA: ATP-binding cassette domain-containing protein [Ktedonobacteraceae bacterium]|nr:ATP-binding cassette domain-containing protein [Chthonomonadales bacterium]HEV2582192.1 ATP-binding cassette domain-containing protein [Ktedonobacteraceae bacterium]
MSVAIRRALPGFTLDVAFDAPPGMTVLFGPSGAGKSLTLQAIAGLLPLDAGSISLDAAVWQDSKRGINLPPQRRHVGYVPQNYALFPHLTVEQNIAFGLKARGRKGIPGRERVSELVELMQLEGLERRRPAQLSGGQQQRVALARALAADPLLLLLDEPFSSLDAAVREALRDELRALHERVHVPIVLVTHDAAETRLLAETVVVIQQGHVLQVGSPDAVFRSPLTRDVAAMVGMKTCWRGRVVSPPAEGVRVLIGDDLVVYAHVPGGAEVSEGQVLELGIRCDELNVLPGDGDALDEADVSRQATTLVPGMVLRVRPQGAFYSASVLLRTGQALDIPLSARELRNLDIEAGSRVTVGIPASAVHVFGV